MEHKALLINHRLESWVYVDATDRTGATGFASSDIGRIAYQTDTGQYWRLIDDSPVTWTSIATGAGLAAVDTASGSPSPGVTGSTPVMCGLAGSITPSISGKLLVLASGGVRNTGTGTVGGQLYLYMGTGAAPSDGDPLTGSDISHPILWRNSADSSACIFPYTLVGIYFGSAGTTYWVDIAMSADTSGTANIFQNHFSIVELL